MSMRAGDLPVERKRIWIAFLLWFVGGGVMGFHFFYLERPRLAAVTPVLALLGFLLLTQEIAAGMLLVIAGVAWNVLAAPAIPHLVARCNGTGRS